jgi:hypothetical protein
MNGGRAARPGARPEENPVSGSTPHYPFPPARGYPLNKCLFLLKSDEAFRKRYLDDPQRVTAELGLDAETRAALIALDRDRLVSLGAHVFLVYQAEGRLRMEREPATLEYF